MRRECSTRGAARRAPVRFVSVGQIDGIVAGYPVNRLARPWHVEEMAPAGQSSRFEISLTVVRPARSLSWPWPGLPDAGHRPGPARWRWCWAARTQRSQGLEQVKSLPGAGDCHDTSKVVNRRSGRRSVSDTLAGNTSAPAPTETTTQTQILRSAFVFTRRSTDDDSRHQSYLSTTGRPIYNASETVERYWALASPDCLLPDLLTRPQRFRVTTSLRGPSSRMRSI